MAQDPSSPLILDLPAGYQRDGTELDCDAWTEGKWARFQNQRPRKMGGYRALTTALPSICRGMYAQSKGGYTYVHLGFATQLDGLTIDTSGNVSTLTARTPAAFVSDANNLWQFDIFRDTVVNETYLVAHAAPNAADIANSTTGKVFYGKANDFTGAFADTTATPVSGGIVVIHPYCFAFGNDGFIQWCVPGKITDWVNVGSGSGYVTSQKIVAGLPLRGTSSGPAALFWSLDSLVRATFVGGTAVWQFDELTTTSSILSPQSVIEHDGIYYWAGVDRFLSFNGVIREIPNIQSLNWFYDNVNMVQRNKVFAHKVPKYGEIWWCFPYGTATECTHAVIYNYRENAWYDTELPNGGRSAGQYPVVYASPIMTGTVADNNSLNYVLWQHEYGWDEINGGTTNAIRSYVRTKEMALPFLPQNPINRDMRIEHLEPDFDQIGNLTFTIHGRANAKATPVETSYTIYETPADAYQQIVPTKNVHRLVSFTFESNVQGGFYYMGKCLLMVRPENARVIGYGV